MKYKIRELNVPHAIVEYSTDDDAYTAMLNVRIDKKPDGTIPTGPELDEYILSFAPQLPPSDPYSGVDWSALQATVESLPPTPEQITAQFTKALQSRLDTFAKTRGYDGILSACTYATSSVPRFAAEGQYCVNARDATWAAAYDILAAVQSGSRQMPTLEVVLAELPALVWPA